jgi:ribosome biogenesis GTPase
VANVDQLLIVSALTNPEPDLVLLDRLLILAEVNSLEPIIIFNKIDLTTEKLAIVNEYEKIGYDVIISSAKTGEGIDEIKSRFAGKISVLAGASGVGKSSILNAILPELSLKTGEVSKKLKRGKHTTRHAQLLVMKNGGLVADTPGFSRLYLPKDMVREELGPLFPEFAVRQQNCKFSTCLHNKEPQCAIKKAVEQGEIAEWRYEHYLQFLDEVINNERSY